MRHLNRYVVPYITAVWYDVGLELFDTEREDEVKLTTLKAETSVKSDKDRAARMLDTWLERKPDASWNDVIKALRSPAIGLNSVALRIEGMLSESMELVSNADIINCLMNKSG